MNYNRVLVLSGCLGCPDEVTPIVRKDRSERGHHLYTIPARYGEPNRISYLELFRIGIPAALVIDLPKAQRDFLGFTEYTLMVQRAAYHDYGEGWAVFKRV